MINEIRGVMMKKRLIRMTSFLLVAALILCTKITANNYTIAFEQPMKTGITAPETVMCSDNDDEVTVLNKDEGSVKIAAEPQSGNETESIQANQLPVVASNNLNSSAENLPYPVATDEELWNQWNEIWLLKLSGVKITSQTKAVKDFMRSALVRMCDDPRYNFNFDYDYINDIIYDDDMKGFAKIGYDFDAGQGIFFNAMNPWNRQMGYCLAYDAIAPLSSTNLDTKRFKFIYNGYDWMIQVWKGQYGGYSTGAEIGTYYRKPDKTYFPPTLYDCVPDEMMLDVEMDLYYKNEFLFTRPMQKSWWVTGFVVFQSCKPSDVRVDAKIVFPNKEMLDAFLTSLEAYGYVLNESYTVEENMVVFSY